MNRFFPDSHITYQIGIRKVTTWVRGFKEVPPAYGLRAKKSSDERRQEEGRGENVQVMELFREGIVAGCPDCEQTQGGWRRKRREALSLGLVDLLAGGEDSSDYCLVSARLMMRFGSIERETHLDRVFNEQHRIRPLDPPSPMYFLA